MKKYMGIDPGNSSGCVAVISEDGALYTLEFSKCTDYEMFEFIESHKCVHAVLEAVHSRPGQSSVATFSFGENFGKIKAFLIAAKIPFTVATPLTWQKTFKAPMKTKRLDKNLKSLFAKEDLDKEVKNIKAQNAVDKKQHKDELRGIAQQLFPSYKITKTMADAVLIAKYCKSTQ
jgi:hypothetical protein